MGPCTWATGDSVLKRNQSVQEPRRCHMTGMLFCHTCHEGELARLPALVLHEWDFQKRPVCGLAAQFLASIQEQPLLDVAAASPGEQGSRCLAA